MPGVEIAKIKPFPDQIPTEYIHAPQITAPGLYILDFNPNKVQAHYGEDYYMGSLTRPFKVTDFVIGLVNSKNYPHANFCQIESNNFLRELDELDELDDLFFQNSRFKIRDGNENLLYMVQYVENDGYFHSVRLKDLKPQIGEEDKNGLLEISMKGVTSGEPYQGYGWIRWSGENPGRLISDSLEKMNTQLAAGVNPPLWRPISL